MVPLPPLGHLVMAVPPQLGPGPGPQSAVLARRLVEAGPGPGVGLHSARELHGALQEHRHLGIAGLSAGGLNLRTLEKETKKKPT